MGYKEFSEYDVVVTSYGLVGSECMKKCTKDPVKTPTKDGLFSMNCKQSLHALCLLPRVSIFSSFRRSIKTPDYYVPLEAEMLTLQFAGRRVVLDEGHQIRNSSTRYAVATTHLLATSKWVLTGTPIVNTIKDLYSMIKYMGMTGGLERMELFNSILTRPLSIGDPNAELILQSIMRTMCLRRRKDMAFIDLKLPEKSEYVHRIAFRQDEKEKYEAIE